jgi:hypothetical protein
MILFARSQGHARRQARSIIGVLACVPAFPPTATIESLKLTLAAPAMARTPDQPPHSVSCFLFSEFPNPHPPSQFLLPPVQRRRINP